MFIPGATLVVSGTLAIIQTTRRSSRIAQRLGQRRPGGSSPPRDNQHYPRRASKRPVPIQRPTAGRENSPQNTRDQLAPSAQDRHNSPDSNPSDNMSANSESDRPQRRNMNSGPSRPQTDANPPGDYIASDGLINDIAAAVMERLREQPWHASTPTPARPPTPSTTVGPDPAVQLQLNALKEAVDRLNPAKPAEPLGAGMLPFTVQLRTANIPTNFEMPKFQVFTGVENPKDHLDAFVGDMQYYTNDGNAFARAFPKSLIGDARRWFTRLPTESIGSWDELARAFMLKFGSKVSTEKDASALFDVIQGSKETIRDYTQRFEKMAARIPRLEEHMYMTAYQKGLKIGLLHQNLVLKQPTTRAELLERVNSFITLEDKEKNHRDLRQVIGQSRRRSPPTSTVFDRVRYDSPDRKKKRAKSPRRSPRRSPSPRRFRRYDPPQRAKQVARNDFTPLIIPAGEVFAEMADKAILPRPSKVRTPFEKRDKNKWCEYHHEHGHTTNECRQLQSEIEKLIKRGHLSEYVDKNRQQRQPAQAYQPPQKNEEPRRITTISGGPGGGGDSNRSRKNYARREIYSLNTPRSTAQPAITFTEDELVGIELPHDDPLIIEPTIGNCVVERILVDTGSSADIIYASTYDKLGLPRKLIQPLHTSLVGFTGHRVHPLGTAVIDVSVGTAPKRLTTRVQFTIVDIEDPAYNGILGRTFMTAIGAIVSPSHLKMKFPTPEGIGEMTGDQKRGRICYASAVRYPPETKKRNRESQLQEVRMVGIEELTRDLSKRVKISEGADAEGELDKKINQVEVSQTDTPVAKQLQQIKQRKRKFGEETYAKQSTESSQDAEELGGECELKGRQWVAPAESGRAKSRQPQIDCSIPRLPKSNT